MQSNFEIYLIGLSVLVFLIFAFILIKRISSNSELKVKIEPVIDEIDNDVDMNAKSQKSFDFEAPVPDEENDDEELAILNLISIDKTNFDIEQLFAFMTNCNAQVRHGFLFLKMQRVQSFLELLMLLVQEHLMKVLIHLQLLLQQTYQKLMTL